MKIDFIGWVFQFDIFIDQKASFLLCYVKTRLKSAVSSVTALIILFYRMNELGRGDNILFNLFSIVYMYKLLNLK